MAHQKSLLITGCSSGIGHDAAHAMKRAGWRVFASCRKPEDCARLADEGLESPHLDHADHDSIRTALAEILAATGGTLDAVFINGAHGLPALIEDTPVAAMREIFEANFFGPHELARQIIPIMRRQGHGRIVLNSSILAIVAYPWRGGYNATKFALSGWGDTLGIELEGTGIHVSMIEPGPIDTMIRKNSIPHFERWIDWKSSARAADYKDRIETQLYGDPRAGRFELPPSAVSKKLRHALEHPRPKARYFVTTPTYIAEFARRFLPMRWRQRVFARN